MELPEIRPLPRDHPPLKLNEFDFCEVYEAYTLDRAMEGFEPAPPSALIRNWRIEIV